MHTDFPALEREVTLILHSRKQHNHPLVIYQNPELFDLIKRALADGLGTCQPFLQL
jgi:hypothetical protein